MKSLTLALLAFFLYPALALAQGPVITITLSTAEATPGHLYLAPIGVAEPPDSLLVLDNQGQVIYRKKLATWGYDFKRLHNGLYSYFDREERVFKLLDSRFEEVGAISAVGEIADVHDLQLSADGGRYLLMIYKDRVGVDMSQMAPGGQVSATVTSCLIQEVDGANNLVWSWDSWDHTPITHTNQNLAARHLDYDHCNSLAYDNDSNILVSSRHLDSVTKIDRVTGNVIWRLGGVGNDFTFTNDPGFSLQHDARRLSGGRLTVFDNGWASRGYSRAVEYDINETTKTITRTWQYWGPFARCCGSVQTLPGGHRLINWGPGKPSVTEVKPSGAKVFELTIAPGFSYRVFRFPAVPPFYFPVIFK